MSGGNNEPGDSFANGTRPKPTEGRDWQSGGSVPIEDHGVIGDLRTVALIGSDGTLDWLCFPHFDSPSVFAALLDPEKGGHFRIAPEPDGVVKKQFYWPDTNVLVTRFYTPDGVGELIDLMQMGGRGGGEPAREVMRRVRVVRGSMSFRMECVPAFDYGRAVHETRMIPGGASFLTERLKLTLSSGVPLKMLDGRGAVARFTSSAEHRAG